MPTNRPGPLNRMRRVNAAKRIPTRRGLHEQGGASNWWNSQSDGVRADVLTQSYGDAAKMVYAELSWELLPEDVQKAVETYHKNKLPGRG